MRFKAFAPGRVNLIGEHTDYTGGLVFPMAIDLGTTIVGERTDGEFDLDSEQEPERFLLSRSPSMLAEIEPRWGRYLAAVAQELPETVGFRGTVSSTVPPGSGLSSSAALCVATAMALGAGEVHDAIGIAELAQRAERAATGVPCGLMDQLASAAGVEGHGLMIDCHAKTVAPIPIPAEARILVVHSGEHRQLEGSEYATRAAQCSAAEAQIGPLRTAALSDLSGLEDPVLVARAHHVISENARVRAFADALTAGDLTTAGELMSASHASLRDQFEVSTDRLNQVVAYAESQPGVFGARLTGAGFGGCVVVLCAPGSTPVMPGCEHWEVVASAGAQCIELG